jgi:hypothetical protein
MNSKDVPLPVIKHFGRWAMEEFEGVYAYHIKPKAGLVAAAGFDANRPELYRVPRSEVEAPAELASLVRGQGQFLVSLSRLPLFVARSRAHASPCRFSRSWTRRSQR